MQRGAKRAIMILKNATIEKFSEYIKTNQKRLVLFGAGTLLKSWIAYVLEEFNLIDSVEMVADNDSDKWETSISICGRSYTVQRIERISGHVAANTVILITSSYFAAMVEQLDEMHELDCTQCYIAAVMHISGSKKQDGSIKEWKWEKRQIPRTIHYCWFGNKQMPEMNRRCIDSWRKNCPGYEIIEWNEKNYDVKKNIYMRQAYEAGMYGYVPDYARIDILYQYGGIYLDTDVEVLRNLDDLLYLKAYTSFEEYPTINFGGGSGSVKGFPLLKKILDFREGTEFRIGDGSYDRTACGYYESVPLQRAGLRLDGTLQNIQGMTVFPSEYFHPRSSVTGKITVTEHTYSVHWFNWSWIDNKGLEEREKNHRDYVQVLNRMNKDVRI